MQDNSPVPIKRGAIQAETRQLLPEPFRGRVPDPAWGVVKAEVRAGAVDREEEAVLAAEEQEMVRDAGGGGE